MDDRLEPDLAQSEGQTQLLQCRHSQIDTVVERLLPCDRIR